MSVPRKGLAWLALICVSSFRAIRAGRAVWLHRGQRRFAHGQACDCEFLVLFLRQERVCVERRATVKEDNFLGRSLSPKENKIEADFIVTVCAHGHFVPRG